MMPQLGWLRSALTPGSWCRHPLLLSYHEQLDAYLATPGTRLMVIGYGFGDIHINKAIQRAWLKSKHELELLAPSASTAS